MMSFQEKKKKMRFFTSILRFSRFPSFPLFVYSTFRFQLAFFEFLFTFHVFLVSLALFSYLLRFFFS